MRRLCITGLIFLTIMSMHIVTAEESESERQENVEASADGRPDGRVPGRRPSEEHLSGDVPHRDFVPRFRGRTVTLEINARLVEQNQTVIWNETHRKETMLGRPVGIKLVGNNIIVDVQFTPYIRRGVGCFLLAQGQIWMEIPQQGIRYHTTVQTIPVEFGEQIYFFPLGPQKDEDDSRIEIMLSVQPHEE